MSEGAWQIGCTTRRHADDGRCLCAAEVARLQEDGLDEANAVALLLSLTSGVQRGGGEDRDHIGNLSTQENLVLSHDKIISDGLPVDTATLTERLLKAAGGNVLYDGANLLREAASALSSLKTRLEEAQRVLAREFDPDPEDDELNLVQLAERAVSTRSVGWGHAGAEIIRRENAEARAVAAEAREKALREALQKIEAPVPRNGVAFKHWAQAVANDALARAALVRGEEKGLEAGDGQSPSSGGAS